MSILKGLEKWIGGIMLFFGVIFFITLFSLNVSGVLSPQYFNSTIHQIINASTSGSIYSGGQTLNSTQINQLASLIGQNPNCNILCFLSQQLSTKTNIMPFLTTSSLGLYQLILEVIMAIGAALMFLSYKGVYTKLTAFGRTLLSSAIISFVSTYIPLMFIVPYFLSGVTIYSFTVSIPTSVVAPFTSVVLSLDIIFGVAGAIAFIIGAILLFRKNKLSKKELPPTQLEIKKE